MDKYKIVKNEKTNVPFLDTSNAIKDYKNSVVAKSENNDCVVRALAAVTDSTYDESHKYVNKTFGRGKGKGTPVFDFKMKMNVGKKVLGSKYIRLSNHTTTTYMKKVKYFCWSDYKYKYRKQKHTLDSKYYPLITKYGKTRVSQMTIITFLRDYNKGKYLIHVRGHAFAIIDGVVIGNSCDAKQLKARIVNAYKFI